MRLSSFCLSLTLRVQRSCSQMTSLLYGEDTFSCPHIRRSCARIESSLNLRMAVSKGKTAGAIVVARGIINNWGTYSSYFLRVELSCIQ